MTKFNFQKRNLLPVLLTLATNIAVSFLTRPFISGDRVVSLITSLDRKILFIPEFIYIYVLAFVQWAICILAVMFFDGKKSRYYCAGISAANIICGSIFLLFPTVMSIRPEYSGSGLTGFIVRLIFSADNPPMNIFPSIHCLFSWACMRMVFSVKRIPLSVKILNAVFSVLVFLSVLFVKQHIIYDIPSGILAFEAGLLIVKILFFRSKNYKEGE